MDESVRASHDYRKRAAELRAEAKTIPDGQTKRVLMDLSASYDKLAKALEARAAIQRD